MCMYKHTYTNTRTDTCMPHVCGCPWKTKEGITSTELELIGSCELPYIRAENQRRNLRRAATSLNCPVISPDSEKKKKYC